VPDYIAYLPMQNGYLVWDAKYERWASTQDRKLATRQTTAFWANVKASLLWKFQVIKASA